MKFGGTSLGDEAGFARVAGLLRSNDLSGGPPPVAVVSAMSGVTDALMMSLRLAREVGSNQAGQSLEPHFERHLKVAAALGSNALLRMREVVENAREEIEGLLEDNCTGLSGETADAARRDAISSYGEILSAQLLTLVLNEHGSPAVHVDARRCIKTDDAHGDAKPLGRQTAHCTRSELQPLLGQKLLPVLGGFIAATLEGVTTTMGRGSSNHTATLVAASLRARETQIWTDVDGVQTADPKLVEKARTISHLSYDEAEELARLGTKVLHQPMFEPVRTMQIPIRIRNSQSPAAEGTLISVNGALPGECAQEIKAITHKNHLVRLNVVSTPAMVANGFQRSIESIFNRYRVSAEIVGRSNEGILLACHKEAPLESIVPELSKYGSVEIMGSQAVVGCVGERMHGMPEAVTKLTKILKSFDSMLDWQKLSAINIVSIVDAGVGGPLVRRLHHELFERN
jgi:aspartate kinase